MLWGSPPCFALHTATRRRLFVAKKNSDLMTRKHRTRQLQTGTLRFAHIGSKITANTKDQTNNRFKQSMKSILLRFLVYVSSFITEFFLCRSQSSSSATSFGSSTIDPFPAFGSATPNFLLSALLSSNCFAMVLVISPNS